MSITFGIVGSCVTRDVLSFTNSLVEPYIARQSLISIVSEMSLDSTLKNLIIENGTHEFHSRCIVDDFEKNSKNKILNNSKADFWIIDLIEERTPLGVLSDGGVITLSQAHTAFSNARSLCEKIIPPFSLEYVDFFTRSLPEIASLFKNKNIILHKAFYAPNAGTRWDHLLANKVLLKFYNLMISSIKFDAIVEADEVNLLSCVDHKWGLAPYHYIDDYYMQIVEKINKQVDLNIDVNKKHTMKK